MKKNKPKILIGICGIGNGHKSRQKSIINELIKHDLEITLALTDNIFHEFEIEYPTIKKVKINIPWIDCDDKGINFQKTLDKYNQNKVDQFNQFLKNCIDIEYIFSGKPDLIITDYEPNVAQYAYATSTPLICMEQQSKFLFLEKLTIDNFSAEEEISRLQYFFPKVDMYIISSFFNIKNSNENIKIIPPIIDKIEKKQTIKNKGIVYFSPYSNNKEDFIKILELLKQNNKYHFVIYTKENFYEYKNIKNFTFKKFNNEFKFDIATSEIIVSSCGHQLISEAIYLEKPLYVFPLNTYEQNYNCKMVEDNGFGKKINDFTPDEFNAFLKNKQEFIKNMKKYKQTFWKEDWTQQFIKILTQKYIK